jgi:hypothetical protein
VRLRAAAAFFEAARGSRPLLLALGWLLHRTAALQHACLRKHRRASVRIAATAPAEKGGN